MSKLEDKTLSHVDITNKTFGQLYINKESWNEKYHLYECNCTCSCGNKISVSSISLTKGYITNCGCNIDFPLSKRTKNYYGKQYGRLTAYAYDGKNHEQKALWKCICACGTENSYLMSVLCCGRRVSCGCLNRKEMDENRDLRGVRFGKLLVTENTGLVTNKGTSIWKCVCDCGAEIELTYTQLLSKRYSSCGCKRIAHRKEINQYIQRVNDTCVERLAIRKEQKNNTSGFRGVHLLSNGRYKVMIGMQKKHIYLGTYDTFEEAVEKRLWAEEELYDTFLDQYNEWKEKAETDVNWAKEHPFKFQHNVDATTYQK